MNSTTRQSTPSEVDSITSLRAKCRGVLPLDARLETWMTDLLARSPCGIQDAIKLYGSPLNVICVEPFARNSRQLKQVARERTLDFQVFFARKANKCLSFVDAANREGLGIDVASEQECHQVLERGIPGRNIICTAAIKTNELIELCVSKEVTIALDNSDELRHVRQVATRLGQPALVAIRVSGFEHRGHKLHSRFGFDVDELVGFSESDLRNDHAKPMRIVGLHFHLDGYCPAQRVSAIRQCLPLIDRLRICGNDIRFLDIGGGLPISYLDDSDQWDSFWEAQKDALLGHRDPLTYLNHGLGLHNIDGEIHGRINAYPYFQTPIRAEWLADVLDSTSADSRGIIADSLRERAIQLRCEPGRSLLDGGGMTIARVEFTKRHHSGDWFIGLAMNRTQCRTGSDDFMVDPLILPADDVTAEASQQGDSMAGYFVGSYCTESELISLRKFHFPSGIRGGDLVILPNTAGYFMHFLESRSHQFPLAKNVVFDTESAVLDVDPIDLR